MKYKKFELREKKNDIKYIKGKKKKIKILLSYDYSIFIQFFLSLAYD